MCIPDRLTYPLAVTCQFCAGVLRHVNGVSTSTMGTAVMKCESCGRGWTIHVLLRPFVDSASVARTEQRQRKAMA